MMRLMRWKMRYWRITKPIRHTIGCVSQSRSDAPQIILQLNSQDLHHLQLFQNTISSDHSISLLTRKKLNGSTTEHCRLAISSKQMAQDLARFGIVPRKTYTVEWPVNIPYHLLRHVLRGLFDGDGCAYIRKSKKFSPQLDVTLTGTIKLLEAVLAYIRQETGITSGGIYNDRRKTWEWGTLRFAGKSSVTKFFDLLYDDAKIFLARKKEKFLPFVNPAY